MKKFQNPILLGGLGVVVLIIIFVAAYFFILSKSSNTANDNTPTSSAEVIPTIQPSDIGLTLAPSSDNKSINITIEKVSSLKNIAYDISYDANVKDPDTGQMNDVPRGVDGSIDVPANSPVIQRSIYLGTCSRNVCVADQVVSGIKITLKVSYTDGHVGQVIQTVNIGQ